MAHDDGVWVLLRDLTTRQMLREIMRTQQEILDQLSSTGGNVSELDVAVEELQAAVDGVAQRLLPKIQELEAALTEAEDALADAIASNDGAQEAIDAMHAAAGDIREEVGRLNALGADPSTPIDTDPEDPIEPPPVDVEPDPDAPHPDQSLPEDQPHPDQSLPEDQPYVDPREEKEAKTAKKSTAKKK